MTIKKGLFCFLLFLAAVNVFSQQADSNTATSETEENLEVIESEDSPSSDEIDLKGQDFHKSTSFLNFIRSMDLVLQFEPGVYINPNKKNSNGDLISAPSPIIYPISIGVLWPNYTFISIQPTLSFFMMNHLWYDGLALPAEIENRTTTTLGFMLNIPAVLTLYLPNCRFQLEAGLGIFMRFGLKAAGVDNNDYGYSGNAGNDVTNINKWFWKDLNWMYLTTSGSWLYNVTENFRIGPTVGIYIPVGSIIKQQSLQGMIISVGLKICR